jgi:hypothetical protein
MKPIPISRFAIAAAVSIAMAGPLWAQTVDDADDNEAIEEIFVTGSRLARDSFNVSTPLVSVSSEAIQDAGIGNVAQILIDEVPSIF